MRTILDQLGVNVASVVIGAMLFLIAVSWIEAFKSLSDSVFFDDGKEGLRYSHHARKKFLSAICATILSIVIVIIVYVIYSNESHHDQDVDSFPGIVPQVADENIFDNSVDIEASSMASISIVK
jgi:hypothetical protein